MAFCPEVMSEHTLRRFVDNLIRHTKKHPISKQPKRSELQEAVAATLGWANYHEAITVLKKGRADSRKDSHSISSTQKKAPKSDWAGGAWSLPSDVEKPTDSVFKTVSAKAFATPVLLKAPEVERKTTFEKILLNNPGKPVCLAQGPLSFIDSAKGATLIEEKPFDFFLNKKTVGEIVDIVRNILASRCGAKEDMWRSRGLELLGCVLKCLVFLRDNENQELSRRCILRTLRPQNIIETLFDERIPKHLRQDLEEFLHGVPLYTKGAKTQKDTTLEQTGYLTMQVAGVFRRNFLLMDFTVDAPSLIQIRLPERTLLETEQKGVYDAILTWQKHWKNGLLFLDVPPLGNEALWDWFFRQSSRFQRDGTGVWLGIGNETDIPLSCSQWPTSLRLANAFNCEALQVSKTA